MSTKGVLRIVLVASAVMLVLGIGPRLTRTAYAGLPAQEPVPPTPAGPQEEAAKPLNAEMAPAGIQSPFLGLWINIRVDNVGNYSPAVAYNSKRQEFLVAWQEDLPGGGMGVFAQRVGADGTLQGGAITIASSVGIYNWQPAVAYNAYYGEYLVVYTHQVSSSDYDIYAQIVLGNGTLWEGAKVVDVGAYRQMSPAVVNNSTAAIEGQYLIVYQSETGSLTGSYAIVGRRMDSWGNLIGTAPTTIASGSLSRVTPDVAWNAARNEYLVVYTRLYYTGSKNDNDIMGQRVWDTLVPVSSEIPICTNSSYDQYQPAVAAGPDEYLVVWSDGNGDTPPTNYDIYGSRVLGNGTLPGGSTNRGFPIASATANNHLDPAVAYGQGYGYLVAWDFNSGTPTGWDIYGRYVMAGQNSPAGSEFAIDGGTYNQLQPALACAPSGDCLEAEMDEYPGSDYEIRGRLVKPYHVYLPLVLK